MTMDERLYERFEGSKDLKRHEKEDPNERFSTSLTDKLIPEVLIRPNGSDWRDEVEGRLDEHGR